MEESCSSPSVMNAWLMPLPVTIVGLIVECAGQTELTYADRTEFDACGILLRYSIKITLHSVSMGHIHLKKPVQ